MELLIDPNVAYLLLVVGVVLAIMALFAPGTGVLEIGALFVLFLAGWEITRLPINLWALVLLIIGVIPFILAVRKSHNLIFLVVALVVFIVGSTFLFQGTGFWPPAVNPFLAIIASLFASGYLWIAATSVLDTENIKPRQDLARIIGDEGEAKTDVYNEGSVQVGSELWSARSAVLIPEGSKIRVVKREGFILEVETLPPAIKVAN